MNNNRLIGAVIAGAFGIGFAAGQEQMRNKINRRLEKAQPLMANGFASIYEDLFNGVITNDQLQDRINEEVNFIKIVNPPK